MRAVAITNTCLRVICVRSLVCVYTLYISVFLPVWAYSCLTFCRISGHKSSITNGMIPRFNQIISNSHRTFANLCTISCNTNKWLTCGFLYNQKHDFQLKVYHKAFGGRLHPNPLGSSQRPPEGERKEEEGRGLERKGWDTHLLLQTDRRRCNSSVWELHWRL